MRHYAIEQWVDFVRGVTPDEVRVKMRSHLSEGCPDCRLTAAFCENLDRVCRGMAALPEVPEATVRCARAIMPARKKVKRVFRLPLELVYDSFLVPAPVGFRSTWQVGWQGLYRAGDCSVDLRIEPDLQSTRATVIGQVSNHNVPEAGMPDTPVFLKLGKLVVAETLSNRFGEFQIEYEQKGRMQLCISLDGGSKQILVPLKKLITEMHAGRKRAARTTGHGDSSERRKC